MTDISGTPSNIMEFNTAAGLIFAELYAEFPVPLTLASDAIIARMSEDYANGALPSGRNAHAVYSHTVAWLQHEGYIASSGGFPGERTVLTTRGLRAMNGLDPKSSAPLGVALKQAVGQRSAAGRIAELAGNFFGGFANSINQ